LAPPAVDPPPPPPPPPYPRMLLSCAALALVNERSGPNAGSAE